MIKKHNNHSLDAKSIQLCQKASEYKLTKKQHILSQIELFDKIYISVFRMRGIVVALVGLALHVNAQFALDVGPPSIHLQMFGKEVINVGKTKKHHNKKSKAHQRKKKSHQKSSKKSTKPIEPAQEIENNLALEENQEHIKTQAQIEKQVVQVVDILEVPQPASAQAINSEQESEVDSSEEDENTLIQNSLIKTEQAAEETRDAQINVKEFEKVINQDLRVPQENENQILINSSDERIKSQPVVLLIKGAPMINLQTVEILDDPKQESIETAKLEDKTETESEIEERIEEEENLRLAKMIKYMPESEKKHLRTMASKHAQN